MRSVKQSGTPSATTKQNQEPSPARVQNVNPTEQLIRRKFQEYYLNLTTAFYLPPHPEERQNRLLPFKQKLLVRHTALRAPTLPSPAIRHALPAPPYSSCAS